MRPKAPQAMQHGGDMQQKYDDKTGAVGAHTPTRYAGTIAPCVCTNARYPLGVIPTVALN
ncbi:hypothetical protein GCM10007898_32220 [Dyella flagellata]|uniref:Uncharacterized protein n=1 Tax=Dyella flagellata TaxID=1867833 RepID=A0ABQ5XDR5_9GAMM|nr:hypothetical protein GCM10007898_32220 [Dyella flagellata]